MSTTDENPTTDESVDLQTTPDVEKEELRQRFRRLTSFQQRILIESIPLERPHGLAIKAELNAYYDKEVNHGRLYPNLDTLVEAGFFEKGAADRRTNVYTFANATETILCEEIAYDSQQEDA